MMVPVSVFLASLARLTRLCHPGISAAIAKFTNDANEIADNYSTSIFPTYLLGPELRYVPGRKK